MQPNPFIIATTLCAIELSDESLKQVLHD
uniref:Uncharacterized protein n=1 Tax=Arundo donax TaxID=35708 RepID=A0A0A9SKZ8_ARUDO